MQLLSCECSILESEFGIQLIGLAPPHECVHYPDAVLLLSRSRQADAVVFDRKRARLSGFLIDCDFNVDQLRPNIFSRRYRKASRALLHPSRYVEVAVRLLMSAGRKLWTHP